MVKITRHAAQRFTSGEAFLVTAIPPRRAAEDALEDALRQKRIAGAALDCFAKEPLIEAHAFRDLNNVLLAPHCIAWTNELFRGIGRAACEGMVNLSLGQRPRSVVNVEVLDRPSFQEKWKRICAEVKGDGKT